MTLQLEIERFFHESLTWDLEMLARSALPSYHSNYPTSPLPGGASGGSNSTVTASKKAGSTHTWLTVDSDYYLVDKLVFYLIDDLELQQVGSRRKVSLVDMHGPTKYTDFLDGVTDHIEKGLPETDPKKKAKEFKLALEHLKGEGSNFSIGIELHSFPTPGAGVVQAEKLLIRFDGCHYVRNDHTTLKTELVASHGLVVPVAGYADRWPRNIVLKKNRLDPENDQNTYTRADL